MASERANVHYNGLNGLRALAVTGVVWHHTDPASGMAVLQRGYMGVDMFFALSGFLITSLLINEQKASGTVRLSKFYARRSLRIFPPYYLALAVAAIAAILLNTSATNDVLDRPWIYVFYLTNWTSGLGLLAFTWSLAAEEQFYLTWPIVFARTGRAAKPILWAALAVNVAWQWTTTSELDMAGTTFTPIVAGTLLAVYKPSFLKRRYAALASVTIMTALLVAAPQMEGPWRTATQVSMAAVVYTIAFSKPTALDWTPLVRLGAVSYGVYLWHMFVRHPIAPVLDGTWLFFPGLLVGSWLTAEVSFRLVETPFLRMKERYR